MLDIAKVLQGRMGARPERPDQGTAKWLVRIAAIRDPAVKLILLELGKRNNATNEKAKRMLGWVPRSKEEAVLASAESLMRLGLLNDSTKKPTK